MALDKQPLLVGLSGIMITALAIVSFLGGFSPWVYERDSASMAAQGIGQDIFDLFIVVPTLIISLLRSIRGRHIALFVFTGSVFYVLYSFAIYCFGVHFNNLFLLYCLVFGSSFYIFIMLIYQLNSQDIAAWFNPDVPYRSTAIYFIIIAIMFYGLWLKDIVPAMLSNTTPVTISDNQLLTNPIHVMDIALALPALFITANLLFKRHKLGFIFAPIFLLFTILLALALIAMVISLNFYNISEDISIMAIFIILAIISTVMLARFFKPPA